MNRSVEHYEQQALQSLSDGSGPQAALAVAVLALAAAVERVAQAIESLPGRPTDHTER
jgi:hypothetical protein